MLHLQRANSVTAGAQIHAPRPAAQSRGPGEIPVFRFVGLLLDERVGVLGEATRGGNQHPAMVGAFGQQAFNQLEAEGNGALDQLRIVMEVLPLPLYASPSLLMASLPLRTDGLVMASQRATELIPATVTSG